jgi:hypothetical protein
MNPGYLGRSELPEGLKALFRPITVVVPDLQLICENMLMAEGFIEAKALAINSSLTQIEYVPPDSYLPNVDNSLPAPELFRHPLVPCAFWCLCLQVAGQLPWWEGCQSGRRRLACQQLAQEGKFPYVSLSAHIRMTPLS